MFLSFDGATIDLQENGVNVKTHAAYKRDTSNHNWSLNVRHTHICVKMT
jgi:hypothetical protein